MEMEDIKQKAEDLTDHIGDYAETLYKVSVLKLAQKSTTVTATILGVFIISVLSVFIMIFGGIALAYWLGDLIESRAGGFLIVAGFFLLLIFVVLMIRKRVVFPYFRNLIIRKIYE
jgi:hypothetical protein